MGGQLRLDLGPWIREPSPSEGFWAYIDVYDLADAIRLAAEATTPGHEVVYIASPDIAAREPLEVLARRFHGDAAPELRALGRAEPRRDLDRQGAAGCSATPRSRSWRDYLDDAGELRAGGGERLQRGETGVQRGRRLSGG